MELRASKTRRIFVQFHHRPSRFATYRNHFSIFSLPIGQIYRNSMSGLVSYDSSDEEASPRSIEPEVYTFAVEYYQ